MKKYVTTAFKLSEYIKEYYFRKFQKKLNSEIKLQKTLYFCFAYWGAYARKNNIPNEYLFGDRIEAWINGPVIPNVHYAKKRNFDGINFEEYLKENIIVKIFINNLLDDILGYNDFVLVEVSKEDKVWKKNFCLNHNGYNNEIKKEEIIKEYIEKLDMFFL